MKFVRKSLETVEAERLTEANWFEIQTRVGGQTVYSESQAWNDPVAEFYPVAIEWGDEVIRPGDYLVTWPDGRIKQMSKYEFERDYEEVVE